MVTDGDLVLELTSFVGRRRERRDAHADVDRAVVLVVVIGWRLGPGASWWLEARQELTVERRRSEGDLELLRDQLAQQLTEAYRKPASATALAPGCAGGRWAG